MNYRFHQRPVFPRGFRCASRNCGIKETGKDLTVFFSEEDATAAAVFTRNHFPGAPVILGRALMRAGMLRGVVVNSRVSNVGTGEPGIQNARRMGAAAEAEFGTAPGTFLMSSTGVIGVPLPIEKIERGLSGIAGELQNDPLVGAEGIMTTDTYAKAVSCAIGDATITIVAKGSGMVAPNMATMLAYIFTDAAFTAEQLDPMLRRVVDRTFNMMSVDTDTSTSDTCAILANGLAASVDAHAFEEALLAVCTRMTEMLARDGEGATKLLRVRVRGAATQQDARAIARSIVDSPLVKTMVYGADPNVGRLLMAVGKCFDCTIEPGKLHATIDGTVVITNGTRASFDEQDLRQRLAGDPIDIELDLGIGAESAMAWGCDLTEGYIRENAAYYSS